MVHIQQRRQGIRSTDKKLESDTDPHPPEKYILLSTIDIQTCYLKFHDNLSVEPDFLTIIGVLCCVTQNYVDFK